MNPNLKSTLSIAIATILTGALTYLAAAFQDGEPTGAKLTAAIVGALAAGFTAYLHLIQTPPAQAMAAYKQKMEARRAALRGFAIVQVLAAVSLIGLLALLIVRPTVDRAAGRARLVSSTAEGCAQPAKSVVTTAISVQQQVCIWAEAELPSVADIRTVCEIADDIVDPAIEKVLQDFAAHKDVVEAYIAARDRAQAAKLPWPPFSAQDAARQRAARAHP